jgi:hypothetical protein
MALTSLAVASVSVWLVFPYFALMALILFAPAGRGARGKGRTEKSEAGSVGGEELAVERTEAWVEDESVNREWGEPAAATQLVVEPAEATASDTESRAVKTKRGKGRMRKARAVAESPGATATWIQIGPGKFVRVETPDPPVAAAFPAVEGEVPGETEDEPTAGEPVSTDVGGDPELKPGPEHDAGPEEEIVAGEVLATDLGMDADLEDDPGTAADAARDNGITPDAFAETTGDNGIAPDAFVDVPPAGIEARDASPQDRDESPIASDDSSCLPYRSTVGTLLAFWRRRRPHSGRVPQRRCHPGVASLRRSVRLGRRPRVSPGLRGPSRRASARFRESCRTFPPRSPPLFWLDLEPWKSTGTISAHPSAKPRGRLDRPRARSLGRSADPPCLPLKRV